jgi:hypothetical protein
MNHRVPTWATYIVAIISIIAGYVWATLFPAAPYTVFAGSIVSVSTAYMVKRASDKKIDSACGNGV